MYKVYIFCLYKTLSTLVMHSFTQCLISADWLKDFFALLSASLSQLDFPSNTLNPFFCFVFKAHLHGLKKSYAACYLNSQPAMSLSAHHPSAKEGKQVRSAPSQVHYRTLWASDTQAKNYRGANSTGAARLPGSYAVFCSLQHYCLSSLQHFLVLRLLNISCSVAQYLGQIPSPNDKPSQCVKLCCHWIKSNQPSFA